MSYEVKSLIMCLTLECFLYSNWDTESDQEFKGYQTGNSKPLGSGHIGITLDDTIKACERFQRLGVEFSKKQLCPSGYWTEICDMTTIGEVVR
ncbi:hypothetical protein Godav_021523 [Gossypium davidsonii]|uniref:Uncharacterized protein n=1 Tax=Gossypium davidsonii TaxID=34287 RepID=A0A7J8R802_GOSDV|nr:hypothetical protein [Gossypium davidsonii]